MALALAFLLRHNEKLTRTLIPNLVGAMHQRAQADKASLVWGLNNERIIVLIDSCISAAHEDAPRESRRQPLDDQSVATLTEMIQAEATAKSLKIDYTLDDIRQLLRVRDTRYTEIGTHPTF